MKIVKFNSGDKLQLKKKHPCGSESFTVLRCGSDVKIVCNTCKREITLPRTAIEKMIKSVTVSQS